MKRPLVVFSFLAFILICTAASLHPQSPVMRSCSTSTAAGASPWGVSTRVERNAYAILCLLSPLGEELSKLNVHSVPDPDFLRRAIALATENVVGGKGGPFGAVIVRDGRVVGEGANSVTATYDPTAHAEMNAIRAACRSLATYVLNGCDLYTSCEPCPMCLAASYWARLDAVYYGCSAADAAQAGFDDAFLYGEFQKHRQFRTLPVRQMLAQEARASFDAWQASPIKIPY